MTVARPEIQPGIDLTDLDLFEHGDPHAAFRLLRREAPMHWHPGTDEYLGFWSLTKYEDVLFVSRHPELFVSSHGISGPGLRNRESLAPSPSEPLGVSIIAMDPPRHVKMRRLV